MSNSYAEYYGAIFPAPGTVLLGTTYGPGGNDLTGTLVSNPTIQIGANNLVVSDNFDGTVTVDVRGATGVWTILVSRFTGGSLRTFSLLTSVTAGTPVTAALAAGSYMAVAVQGATVLTPKWLRVYGAVRSLHMRCMESIREYVLSMSLPYVTADPNKHLVVKFPYRPNTEFQSDEGVYYFPINQSYSIADNEYTQARLGVHVCWIKKSDRSLQIGLEDALYSLEMLARAVSETALPDVCEIHTVEVQQAQVILPEQWRLNYDASSVVMYCIGEQVSEVL